jgi:DNA-directed RNA polymerase subunit RPC12/RpoP
MSALQSAMLGGQSMEPDAPNCPQCEARMLQAPRPLKRIFGDVRAFECASCSSMIIEYAFERIRRANNRKFADAAE